MMDGLHAAFHRPQTRTYQVVNAAVWVLIVASIATFMLDDVFSVGNSARL